MTVQEQHRILIDYLNLKVALRDWKAVSSVADDLLRLDNSGGAEAPAPNQALTNSIDVPLAAIPPVQLEIPHHPNEVVSILRMSDEAMVDAMWPDYTKAEGDT